MEWLKELGRRMEMLVHRRRFRADLEEEMRLHVDLRQQQQAERGLAADEARTAAMRRFGNPESIKERSHAAWGWGWLESLAQDTIYGVRAMLRSPGVTAVALLSLALGIGANTAIFTLMDAVMLRSLPVKDPARLFLLGEGLGNGITDEFARTDLYSYPAYRRIQMENRVFSDTAALFSMTNDVHGYVGERTELEPMQVQLVSGSYFQTLGVQPLLGRMLSEEDDNSEGNHPVAVVSYAWWRRSLGRDPAVLSKTLRIGSAVFSIAGVAPPEFFGTTVGEAPDIWIPLSMIQAVPPHWNGRTDPTYEALVVFGRLKTGVTPAEAAADVNLIYQQIFRQMLAANSKAFNARQNAEKLEHTRVPLTPMENGLSEIRSEFSEPLNILMTVVALVLLIACANIANLLLARSTSRARELAVRQALGAGRARLVRQLLTESLLLALAGGALGVAFASVGARLLLRMVSRGDKILPLDVHIHANLLLFTLAVSLFTALLFGTIPAFRATRLKLVESLKDGRGATGGAAKSPLAKTLVVTQVAFSLVLLAGAGLFLRSLVNLNHVDSGFNIRDVLLFKTDESSAGYVPNDPRLSSLHREVEERLRALPGVVAASYSSFTMAEGSWNGSVFVQGFDNDKNVDVRHNIAGTGYFATMGIPLAAGRGFRLQDTATSPKVAIISEHMARTLFPAGSPIGRHYGNDGPKHAGDIEVIGVARDVKFENLAEPATDIDYYPYTQYPGYLSDFEVRYSGDTGAIASAVQKTIHAIDSGLPITQVTTLEDRLAATTVDERLVAELSAFFGLLAVFLSSIGIYGLMSYLVGRRTSEIGVRMALGADPAQVRWLVMREILLLVGVGIAIGVPVTLGGGRLVESMLFGLKGNDPLSVACATGLLLAVTLLAGYLPARRASRVDPVVALRCE
jgi:predicted permease